ncbi:MAG: DUF1566 domain-containing protein [Nitrospina sp.]|nr:DUF1566 domain-containing protein [Nitrospina sp.]
MFLSLAVILPEKGESVESWSVDKRFKDNGDKTITDTKTGLMWMKEDSYLHSGHWVNWFKSIQFIKQMNKEGFANEYDWRLPTIDQLTTLYEMDKMNSKVLGKGMNIHIDPIFAKEGSGSIWSIDENGNHNAFGLVFNTGKRFNSSKNSTFQKAVRAVRYLN